MYWHPNVGGNSGSHFFAKYRIKGQTTWLKTDEVLDSDHVIVRALQPDQTYEFYVVSVDGGFIADSAVQEVSTAGIGNFQVNSQYIERKYLWCFHSQRDQFVFQVKI